MEWPRWNVWTGYRPWLVAAAAVLVSGVDGAAQQRTVSGDWAAGGSPASGRLEQTVVLDSEPIWGDRGQPSQPITTPPGSKSTRGAALIKTTSSLAVVLGLLFLGVWFVRRSGIPALGQGTTEPGRVLGRFRVAGKQHAHVIQFGDRILLVAQGPTGLATLAEMTDPEECARLRNSLAGTYAWANADSRTHG